MTQENVQTIGFIGSGNIGSHVAKRAVAAGYKVVMSNSRGPETLKGLVEELNAIEAGAATASTAVEAGTAGDIVVVSIPFVKVPDVPVEPLAGKIVIDTNNYYPQRDGHFAELDAEQTTVSGELQKHLPTSKVVKAFNHIRFSDITEQASPAGTPNRRALTVAGDDAEARAFVSELLDQFGFDVVDLGPLAESWRIQKDSPAYGSQSNAEQLADLTANAVRPSPSTPSASA